VGVHILYDDGRRNDYRGSMAALYCSTTDVAFGPVFSEDGDKDAGERAEAFLRFLQIDARKFTDEELQTKYSEWLRQEAAQYAAEAQAEREKDADLDT
jgi:hypothetical protein